MECSVDWSVVNFDSLINLKFERFCKLFSVVFYHASVVGSKLFIDQLIYFTATVIPYLNLNLLVFFILELWIMKIIFERKLKLHEYFQPHYYAKTEMGIHGLKSHEKTSRHVVFKAKSSQRHYSDLFYSFTTKPENFFLYGCFWCLLLHKFPVELSLNQTSFPCRAVLPVPCWKLPSISI